MRLTGFDLYRYSLPLTGPLKLKEATLEEREGLLLELRGDDGSMGWGEIAPLPGFSAESLEEAGDQLRSLTSFVMGYEATGDGRAVRENLSATLDRFDLSSSVRFGFELAIWDLCAAGSGVSLAGWAFPGARAAVSLNGLLAGSPERVLEEARRMRESGYLAVKLKVGARSVEEDVSLVRALRRALGENIALRLDANRAWSFEEAARFADGLQEVRYEYVEEPLADASRLAEIVRECGVAVALDESLVDMKPGELEEHRYASAVVLKPTLLGGLSRTLRFAETASRLGMTPVTSAAYESGVGTGALVALAAGIWDRATPAGLDTYRRLAEDVSRPRLDLSEPCVSVEKLPGGRRVLDHRWLKLVE